MKDIRQLPRDFRNMFNAYQKYEQNKARIVGIEAVKDVKLNFKDQKFGEDGDTWKERSEATNKSYNRRGNYKGSVYGSDKPLLVQTGNMRDSISWEKKGKDTVFVGISLSKFPGAKLLNEGGPMKAWGNPTKMPKRKYLGWTPRMGESIRKRLKVEYDKIFAMWK